MATKHTASQLYLPGFNPLSLFAEPHTKSIAVQAAVDAGAAEVAQVISLDDDGVVEVVPTQVAALPEVQPAPTPIAATADEGDDYEADLVPAAPIVPRVEAVQRINPQVSRDQAPWPELPATLHDDLGGKVAKYEANVAALALLQRLEASQAEPTDAERITLSRYTGWGGLKEVFDGYQDWRARKESLLALIGEDAFAQARGSIVNAHYTPMLVVKTMWDAVRAMGFTGGRILEPSSGTGYFFGGMPADIARRSEMTAVELDELSTRITKAIYGHAATVHHTGFEKFSSPDGWFSLAISNVPFGTYTVACGRRRAYSKWTIHNYFLGRMLDAVRPGGLVALITSSHFMDSKEHLKRAWVHNRAELVGAVRLPQGAFSRVANTDVVADMLFFRRREAGALPTPGERAWMQLAEIPQEQMRENVANSMRMRNEFWGANPESVAGRWTLTQSQRGQVLTPVCKPEDFPALFAKAASALPTNVYVPPAAVATPVAKVVSEVRDQANGEKPGSFVMHNDAVHVVTNGVYEPVETARTRLARIVRLIEVRDATRALLTRQLQVDATEAELEGLRRKLNMQYDSMVRQHGWIHSKGNAMAFRQDPDWPLLLSLENYDDEKDVATKAAIFTTRTGKPSTAPVAASTPEDAVAISIAETGHLNPSYLGQLLGLEADKVMPHLATLSLAFLNPETGLYESREEYLCGNVRTKLRAAEFAGEAYTANVRALLNVIPADLPPGDIDVRLGTPWIPTTDYVEFVRSLEPGAFSSSYVTLDVTYDRLSGVWALKTNAFAGTLNKQWGTAEIDATRIIVEAMNGRQVTVYDVIMVDGNEKRVVNVENTAAAREMQGKVEANFKEWVWADDERSKRLHRLYNDEYNSVVERRFDGSRLRLPGYSWVLAPSEHQLSAVARLSTCNNTLLAHCVGAGKTLSMVMGSMELKRLGLVDKPAHVVPNHMPV